MDDERVDVDKIVDDFLRDQADLDDRAEEPLLITYEDEDGNEIELTWSPDVKLD